MVIATLALLAALATPMVVVDESKIVRDEPPPHGNIGMSTVSALTDGLPGHEMEFKKRALHKGAAIGPHLIDHDEVYYVLSGEGDALSDGVTKHVTHGMMAYFYKGSNVGITQTGDAPLTLIISYPLVPAAKP